MGARELTSQNVTFAGIGGGDLDATTSPHPRDVPAPAESGVVQGSQASGPASNRSPKHEDEVTIQHPFFSPEQAEYEAAQMAGGFDDLDEKTSVLSGAEPGLEIESVSERTPTSPRVRSSLENTGGHRLLRTRAQRETDRPKAMAPSEPPPPSDARETTARIRAASPRDGVVSYRIAFEGRPDGSVQLYVLRPGEIAEPGQATAFIVPTDVASSEVIAAFLARKV